MNNRRFIVKGMSAPTLFSLAEMIHVYTVNEFCEVRLLSRVILNKD